MKLRTVNTSKVTKIKETIPEIIIDRTCSIADLGYSSDPESTHNTTKEDSDCYIILEKLTTDSLSNCRKSQNDINLMEENLVLKQSLFRTIKEKNIFKKKLETVISKNAKLKMMNLEQKNQLCMQKKIIITQGKEIQDKQKLNIVHEREIRHQISNSVNIELEVRELNNKTEEQKQQIELFKKSIHDLTIELIDIKANQEAQTNSFAQKLESLRSHIPEIEVASNTSIAIPLSGNTDEGALLT